MAVHDNKKVQTMVNVAGQQMLIIRQAISTLQNVRTAYVAANPTITGTVLEGNVSALNTSLNAIDTQAQLAVWDTLISGIVPSHRNEALN